jgi:hypothetical protein
MIKILIPAAGLATLGLLLAGIPQKQFGRKLRLDFDSTMNSSESKYLAPILDRLRKDAQLDITKGEVNDIALYYRDLNGGGWIAINKDENFNIASLMKVPLMIECLENAESNPALLKERLSFKSDTDWTAQQNIKPVKTLERGKSYSLDETMFRMVAYSDNNAMELLLEKFPSDNLFQFLSDHQIDFEKEPDGIKMSLDTYSRFFGGLYDRSLLNEAMSKKAFSYLAAEEFPQGMRSAVPSNVVVESKFGEKVLRDENGKPLSAQLHEVGIILDGDHPFLLGIMTEGKDLPDLEDVIRDITRDAYEETEHSSSLNQNKMDCMSRCHVNHTQHSM